MRPVILILSTSAAIVAIVLLTIFGVMGYIQSSDNCLVVNCTNPTIFYESRHRSVSHITIQPNRKTLMQRNGEYYDLSPNCTQIPEVVKCYYYYLNTKYGEIEHLGPVPRPEPFWLFAGVLILIPMAILVACLRGCKCKRLGKRGGIALLVIGALYTIGVFLLMILGGIGLIDNVSEQCLRSSCTLGKTISPSGRSVTVPKVTIVTNKLNRYRELNRLEYTYYDFDKRNCSEVSELITCCYSTAQKAIDLNRMHNPKFAYGIALLIVSCVIFGFGVSGLRSYKSQSVDLELSEPVTCVTENVGLDIDKESTDDLRS